jgi:transcription initiation factor TFIIIB Brf1 subunit/transcription initiation factor TFIIB
MKDASCPECHSKRLLYGQGKLKCTNCGTVIGATFNKYGAKKQEFNGKIYDSKFEASVAGDLELRKRAGDILDYDIQYKVEAQAFDANGKLAFTEKHKVDFRIHHTDGSYELYEAKGVETDNYKFKRKCLENLWLPLHPDHIYTVIKQSTRRRK